MDKSGNVVDDRQSIVDVFAEFYRELYQSARPKRPTHSEDVASSFPELDDIQRFTKQKVKTQLLAMKGQGC
jgi:hypothetical protein